ncbi:LOG family protein [Candidatus Saccharibacteria bacterium]|nr:LOG family protein [Candidatus Saccharibacteria bacterium]
MQNKNNDLSHVCMPLRYSICVSGAAAGDTVKASAEMAERLGAAIAKHGHTLTTGATIGLPYHAAKGAKMNGGESIGYSPASSLREHLRKYRLPHCHFDFINFTGLNYVGRDQYLVQSSDAVITVGGRFGSLHEFVTALEAGKPCGILVGSGGAADIIPGLMESLDPPHKSLVIYDDNPENLVKRITDILDIENKDLKKDMMRDEHWFMDGSHNRAG